MIPMMVLGSSSLKGEHCLKGCGKTTKMKSSVYSSVVMEDFTRESLKMINGMGKEDYIKLTKLYYWGYGKTTL